MAAPFHLAGAAAGCLDRGSVALVSVCSEGDEARFESE